MVGLAVNARSAWPTTDEIAELGLPGQWVRSIVYDLDEFDRAIQGLPANVLVCALLNSETEDVGQFYDNWLPVVRRFAERFSGRVGAVECGNELDLLGVPVEVAIRLVQEASEVLREHGMLVIASSVAGPDWPTYIERLGLGVHGFADYVALHPYGQRANGFPAGWGFGELQEVVPTARERSGLPIALTEFGIKVGDAGGENAQAIYLEQADTVLGAMPSDVLAFYTLFCISDQMGSPGESGDQGFGLKRQAGSHRPSWSTFARLNHGPKPIEPPMPSPDDEFVLGFKEWHDHDSDLIGDPVGRERGGIPGFSVQRTTKGRLMAQNLVDRGWTLTFWDDVTDARWMYEGSQSRQIG